MQVDVQDAEQAAPEELLSPDEARALIKSASNRAPTGVRNRAQLADVGVRIGGELAEVQYAGAQGDFFGLDQLNVKAPRTLIGRGDVALIFSVAGRSATPVTVNIR